MKLTVNINLGGSPFIMDEDAYKILKAYLGDISSRIPREDGEMVNDIEARLAEIFNHQTAGSGRVVDVAMVDRAIATIGAASEFGQRRGSGEYSSGYSENKPKRFYRNTSNAVLGGVCSGIADYFRIDVVLVRILALASVIIFGTGILLYLIVWIVAPRKPKEE